MRSHTDGQSGKQVLGPILGVNFIAHIEIHIVDAVNTVSPVYGVPLKTRQIMPSNLDEW